ncbi:MAG TPA: cbb3-type cytochrome oxidase assembly protein CcoS [Acidiferrobacterales bacterium]|nr:cbb3-type cytochrome oxidase assembly protein CcoS [Acidiferrobacterales bacterium]
MEILYLLIPIAILLVAAMVAGFVWASKSGQFDDLEGPAHRILMDKDEPQEPVPKHAAQPRRRAGKHR